MLALCSYVHLKVVVQKHDRSTCVTLRTILLGMHRYWYWPDNLLMYLYIKFHRYRHSNTRWYHVTSACSRANKQTTEADSEGGSAHTEKWYWLHGSRTQSHQSLSTFRLGRFLPGIHWAISACFKHTIISASPVWVETHTPTKLSQKSQHLLPKSVYATWLCLTE